jgi:hypothetical protein
MCKGLHKLNIVYILSLIILIIVEAHLPKILKEFWNISARAECKLFYVVNSIAFLGLIKGKLWNGAENSKLKHDLKLWMIKEHIVC